jgi:hypothetical protein
MTSLTVFLTPRTSSETSPTTITQQIRHAHRMLLRVTEARVGYNSKLQGGIAAGSRDRQF